VDLSKQFPNMGMPAGYSPVAYLEAFTFDGRGNGSGWLTMMMGGIGWFKAQTKSTYAVQADCGVQGTLSFKIIETNGQKHDGPIRFSNELWRDRNQRETVQMFKIAIVRLLAACRTPLVHLGPQQKFAASHERNEPLMADNNPETLPVEKMFRLEQNRHDIGRAGERSLGPCRRLAPDFANQLAKRVDIVWVAEILVGQRIDWRFCAGNRSSPFRQALRIDYNSSHTRSLAEIERCHPELKVASRGL